MIAYVFQKYPENFAFKLFTIYQQLTGISEFLDSGRKTWTLDSGCWTLDAGHWTLDSGLWSLDAGLLTPDFGLWTLNAGLWTFLRLRKQPYKNTWEQNMNVNIPISFTSSSSNLNRIKWPWNASLAFLDSWNIAQKTSVKTLIQLK